MSYRLYVLDYAIKNGVTYICVTFIKDGAYYCYCAYVLHISRNSGFLWLVLTNTGKFLRGLKLCGERRTQQLFLVFKKKIGGNHSFFRDNLSSVLNRTPYIALYFNSFYKYC